MVRSGALHLNDSRVESREFDLQKTSHMGTMFTVRELKSTGFIVNLI